MPVKLKSILNVDSVLTDNLKFIWNHLRRLVEAINIRFNVFTYTHGHTRLLRLCIFDLISPYNANQTTMTMFLQSPITLISSASLLLIRVYSSSDIRTHINKYLYPQSLITLCFFFIVQQYYLFIWGAKWTCMYEYCIGIGMTRKRGVRCWRCSDKRIHVPIEY